MLSVLLTSGALSYPVLIDTLKLQQLDDLSIKSLLVIIDVISLYTNVLHQEGFDACRETLNKRDVLDPPTEDIVQLALFFLNKNNFFFNVLHYSQKHRTAMGTRTWPHPMQLSLWASLSVTFCNRRGKTRPSGGGI